MDGDGAAAVNDNAEGDLVGGGAIKAIAQGGGALDDQLVSADQSDFSAGLHVLPAQILLGGRIGVGHLKQLDVQKRIGGPQHDAVGGADLDGFDLVVDAGGVQG